MDLTQVTQELASGNQTKALEHLVEVVSQLKDQADIDRDLARQAQRLIAENMFAIVRLEIAQATDQIINNALIVKRERTGSGNAAFALTVTATLVMLAGNVLSGGGMTLLGGLLVAVGEMQQGAAKNKLGGVFTGVTHLASGIVGSTTNGGRDAFADQRAAGYQWNKTSDVVNNKVETRSKTEGYSELISTGGEKGRDLVEQLYERFKNEEKKDPSYVLTKKQTAWIDHGAGGTNAITHDVQEAITAAYAEGLAKINLELNQKQLKGAILGQLLAGDMKADTTLHPMTRWVVDTALGKLATSTTNHYQKLDGGSGFWGSSTLQEAQRAVKKSFEIMKSKFSAGGLLMNADDLVAELKPAYLPA